MINKGLSLLLLLVLFSCTNEESTSDTIEEGLDENFTVSGTILNGQNQSFYVETITQRGPVEVAKGKSDGTGKFEIKGNIPGFGLYQLRMGEKQDKIIPLTIVPNDKVVVNASYADYSLTPRIEGTQWSDVMTRYMEVFSKFHLAQAELRSNPGNKTPDEQRAEFLRLKEPLDAFALEEMEKDPANPFNIVLSGSATPNPMEGFDKWDPKKLDILNAVADAFNKNYPNTVVSNTLSQQVYQIELQYNDYVANNSGTRPAPEIALNNPQGVEMKLSDLRGKYVLIDFWASWCGPCRRESPNVVRMYNKYKNKGFTIFSVSLDDNADKWKQAIKDDGLIWPYHVSDLKNWESPMPQLYNFSGIPHTVLVNPQGNIIGVGLRGASLEQKLEEIFTN